MPETRNEDLGRRLFITNREKAVEEAVQKIRHALGHSWEIFSKTDIGALSFILGEVWVAVGRGEWATYSFSRLDRFDIDHLITLGKKAERAKRLDPGDISDAKGIHQKTM